MYDPSVPLGRVNRNLLLLLDNCHSALILVLEPIGKGGPEDAAANNHDVPRIQMCYDLPKLR